MTEYKGYMIEPLQSLIGYRVNFVGRGSAHKSLRGMFTSVHTAKQFIDDYLKQKEGKEVEQDGKRNRRRRIKPV